MPRNGNGNYNLPQPAFTPGTTISSTAVNSDFSDIASALTGSVSADGQTSITGQLRFPSGTAASPAISFASDLTTGMYYIGTGHLGFSAAGTQIVGFNANNLGTSQSGDVIEVNTSSGIAYPNPVGMVVDFAGTSAPNGWLLCFGQILNASSYPELFAAMGGTYGGNGTTTFGIPDCRGRVSAGKDNMGGSTAGRITVAGGNFDATALGGTGGGQNHTILQVNFPAVNFTVSGITLNDPGHAHNLQGATAAGFSNPTVVEGNGFSGTLTNGAGTNTTGITISSQGTAASGGSGTALATLDPVIIFNKIIYAGRP